MFILSAGILGVMFLGLQWLIRGAPFLTRPDRSSVEQPQSSVALSSGQYGLLNGSNVAAKTQGMAAIAAGDFLTAANTLKTARETNIDDPETLIYLNNARIGDTDAHELAVIVPAATNPLSIVSNLCHKGHFLTTRLRLGCYFIQPLSYLTNKSENIP